jgi:hypothetical protein
MAGLRFLDQSEWRLLRDVRLRALKNDPESFLSTYEREATYHPSNWQVELERGMWLIAFHNAEPVGLLGATPEPDIAPDTRYLAYLY